MTSVGRSAWCTTALETLPSSIERRPVSPREPMTIVAASWRSAISTIVFHTGPLASTATARPPGRRRARCEHLRRRRAAVLGGRAVELDEVDHRGGLAGEAQAAQAGGRLPHRHDERVPADEAAAPRAGWRAWRPRIRRSRGAVGRRRSTCAPGGPPRTSSAARRSAPRCGRSACAPASWRALRCAARSGCGRA